MIRAGAANDVPRRTKRSRGVTKEPMTGVTAGMMTGVGIARARDAGIARA